MNDRQRGTYERIKQAVISGELQPSEPLIETALAEWCEVSRTPIREALTRLEQDGIAVRTDRGLIVREDSPEDVLDLYETRIALEAAAARMAAERRGVHDLLKMSQLAQRMHEMTADSPQDMAAVNAQFHEVIWRAGRNRSMIDLLDRLRLHLGRYPATTLAYPGRWARSNEQHLSIIEAIEARDDGRAAELAEQHFTEARDVRLKLWMQDHSSSPTPDK